MTMLGPLNVKHDVTYTCTDLALKMSYSLQRSMYRGSTLVTTYMYINYLIIRTREVCKKEEEVWKI